MENRDGFKKNLRFYLTVIVCLLGIVGKISAQTGRISVASQPMGALVWLDDNNIGTTPIIDRETDAGFHTLRLTDPLTNATATQTVQIPADSTVVVNVVIGGSTGYLSVESKPSGAEVSLVTVIGKTPLRNAPINPGAYSVRVEHPGKVYSKVTEDAIIPENGSKKLDVTFPKNHQFIGKTTARILLGAAAVGLYSWGYAARANDNRVGGIVGFTLGTVCLVGIEVFSF